MIFSASLSLGQSFVNGSLENWASPTICETNTPPDNWSNYSNVGLGPDEANFPLCPTTIPSSAANGSIYARCLSGNPHTGEGMFQIVSGFIPGFSYAITYFFCGSNRFGGTGDSVWHLFIDDIDVNQSVVFSSLDTVWHANIYQFTATSTSHKIGVRAYTPTYNGGGSAAIDHFLIENSGPNGIATESSTPFSIGPNPFSTALTLNDDGRYSSAQFILLDMTGQIILNESLSEKRKINTETLEPNVYYYLIRSDEKVIQRGRLIKTAN